MFKLLLKLKKFLTLLNFQARAKYQVEHFVVMNFFHPLRNLMHAKLLQSCLTLCDPMDCSPPGSSVLGILQARIPEWVTMPSSSRSPVAPALQADSLLLSH